jgi:hypothetical protein
MAGKDQYKAKDFIKAIAGSGGIISVIARRVGCNWSTAKKYIDDYATVNEAYYNECQSVLDLAESTVLQNIKDGNSADAKWYLARKGKLRGYSDGIDLTSGNEPITFIIKRDTGEQDAEGN